jgi:cellulose synthase/poly-beta-1,6-N-acetylglucosamine synthase-like glycosyltransferase
MNLSPLLIISVVFSVLYFLVVLYFLMGWLRLEKQGTRDGGRGTEQPFVSIVIPVRNEAKYITACLESIFKQNYPAQLFEVIVIDDYSLDDTLQLAEQFGGIPVNKNLTLIDLQHYLGKAGEHIPNKKKAIALGIKNAKGELILTTDGDCTMDENWLQAMVSAYQQTNCKMLTGPVAIQPARSPFAWFQQLDVINQSAMAGAAIRNGLPSVCNGANLMYAKETYQEVEGFKGNYDVPTGEDIFLMQKIEKRWPGSVSYAKNIEAAVFTKTESGLGSFVSQRSRWVSKCTDFSNWKMSAVLYFSYFFNLLIVIAAGFAFTLQPMSWLPVAVIGGTKVLIEWLFNIPVAIFFRKKLLLPVFPILSLFHVLYVIIIGVLSLRGRYRWKDRMIKYG